MHKKFCKSVIVGTMTMIAVAQAAAEAPTSELRVTGTLDVPGCEVTLDNDGVYDFGTIRPDQIPLGIDTANLPPISQNFSVNCTGSTYLTYKVVDNAASSASSNNTSNFGLGMVNGTGKIGYYRVIMGGGMVDGEPSQVFTAEGSTINGSSSASLGTNRTQGWSSGNALQAGKLFEARLNVLPTLAGTRTMNGPLTEETNMSGSLTLNFAFGL